MDEKPGFFSVPSVGSGGESSLRLQYTYTPSSEGRGTPCPPFLTTVKVGKPESVTFLLCPEQEVCVCVRAGFCCCLLGEGGSVLSTLPFEILTLFLDKNINSWPLGI